MDRKLSRAEKSTATRDALFRAALTTVAAHGYAKASIARITAAAGVSQGTFYSYFDNQQELLAKLLPVEGEKLLNELAAKSRGSADYFDLERKALLAFFEYNALNPHFLRVLTEAEIAAPESFAEHMANIGRRYVSAFRRAVDSDQIRPQKKESFRAFADFLSGSRGHIAFGMSLNLVELPIGRVADAYIKFIRSGVGGDASASAAAPRTSEFRPTANADVRAGIIEAAGSLIYQRGFVRTTIADVAQAVGIGIGTFYRNFESRESLLGELLEAVRNELLDYVREEVAGSSSFAEMETRGFLAFFRYISAKPWLVRIESEAALWAPNSYADHLRDFTGRYLSAMAESKRRGELAAFEPDEFPVLAFIFMAARHYLGVRYMTSVAPPPRHVQKSYAEFVVRGFAPR
jgi:AcrR family transcriptional regulator